MANLIFGQKHPEAVFRKSVGGVVVNPEKNKVLGLDWKIYDVFGIVQGGVEEGDKTDYDTLNRELVEETGYTDYKILDKLGENITSYFYVDVKNVWRELELACYLVQLNSYQQNKRMLEEHEAFDLVWITIDDYINQVYSHIPTQSNNFQGIGEFLKRAKQIIEVSHETL